MALGQRRRSHEEAGDKDVAHSTPAAGEEVVAAPRYGPRNAGATRPPRWAWLVGVAAAAAVLGPALAPGSVFALDAAFIPRIPVPAGVWGLGPELPRRVPLGLALSWLSAVVGGAAAGKLLLGAALVLAFTGATRLVADHPWPTQLASGLLYGLSPLVLTRVGAGEWTAVAAFAVLPWAVPTLLDPARDRRRTFLWSAAMAATGVVGGVFALLVVAVAVAAERTTAVLVAGALAAIAQAPWLVPGVIVAAGGGRLAGSGAFATRARGLVGVAGVLAGHGFWRLPSQVGGDAGVGVALLGAGLLCLAVVGARGSRERWRRRGAIVAGVGLVIALASALPGVRVVANAVTATMGGGPFREGQRFAVLFLVWLAPAAAVGAQRLASDLGQAWGRLAVAAPALAAVALAIPGLWGVGGRLQTTSIPEAWAAARTDIAQARGPVLALPFHRYLDLPAAGNRRVLNPLPDYLGGDVIASSDPELGSAFREFADPREATVKALLAQAAAGQPVADGLAAIGVRWIVLLHAVDWRSYDSLRRDPGLRTVVADPSLDLFTVNSWRGPVVDSSGRSLALGGVIAPVKRLAASAAAVWAAPAAAGWMRGTRPVGRTPDGLLALPAGGGILWYWPAAVVLLVDVATGLAVATAVARRAPRERPRSRGSGRRPRPPRRP
ncbi:MAG TPA: hypothetical protein VHT75_06770 [Acidimicrobiales bacterium]|nr:hypothetical protein [Acidimicrobiales bacterium]